jgi:hypothetical protein
MEEITVEGLAVSEVQRRFQTGLEQIAEILVGYACIVAATRCSGCTGAAATAFSLGLNRYGKRPADFKGLSVFVGTPPSGPGDGPTVVIGAPAAESGPRVRAVPGCPPPINAVWQAISDVMGWPGERDYSWY